MKNKCITFDKEAQNNLPQHIKDKMKADREKAQNKQITKAFYFGAKVKFISADIHQNLKGKAYCLIGFTDNAFAVVEWKNRGGYNFEYFTGSVYDKLALVE